MESRKTDDLVVGIFGIAGFESIGRIHCGDSLAVRNVVFNRLLGNGGGFF